MPHMSSTEKYDKFQSSTRCVIPPRKCDGAGRGGNVPGGQVHHRPAGRNGFYYDFDLRANHAEDLAGNRNGCAGSSPEARVREEGRLGGLGPSGHFQGPALQAGIDRRPREGWLRRIRQTPRRRPEISTTNTISSTCAVGRTSPTPRKLAGRLCQSTCRWRALTGVATSTTRCCSASMARPGKMPNTQGLPAAAGGSRERRDHRKLGKELEIFFFDDEVVRACRSSGPTAV